MTSPEVLHVTEALAGGVLSSLVELMAAQRAEGLAVTLMHLRRDRTPPREVLERILPSGVELIELESGAGGRHIGLLKLARTARRFSREHDCIVHVHSSLAGAACRAPFLRPAGARAGRLFYSPHGYGFLRRDQNAAQRAIYRGVERWLGRIGTSVLVSESESAIARSLLRIRASRVLSNTVDMDELDGVRPSADGASRHRPLVVMVGRICFQKAPWAFAAVARALEHAADFQWIGDGADSDRTTWIGDAPVHVTGWLPRAEVLSRLKNADVVCFYTLWEGLPMSLIEAQGLGRAAVASSVPGNSDVIEDGVTGLLVENEGELAPAILRLIQDGDARGAMGASGRLRVMQRFERGRLSRDVRTIYALPATAANASA